MGALGVGAAVSAVGTGLGKGFTASRRGMIRYLGPDSAVGRVMVAIGLGITGSEIVGYLIGIGGPITYKKSTLPDMVRALPWEALVVHPDNRTIDIYFSGTDPNCTKLHDLKVGTRPTGLEIVVRTGRPTEATYCRDRGGVPYVVTLELEQPSLPA